MTTSFRNGLGALALCLAAGCAGNSDKTTAPPPAALALDGGALPLGLVGRAYEAVIAPSGGTAPYTFDVAGGLPDGVTTSAAGNTLALGGTPTAASSASFTVTVTDKAGKEAAAVFVLHVADGVDTSGDWQVSITVTAADGSCDGEAGTTYPATCTITQSGAGPVYTVSVAGFLGEAVNTATGTLDGNTLDVSGSWPEDGGTTTARHIWRLTSPTTLTGEEIWSWSSPGGTSCPNGRSTVTASRIP